MKLVLLLSLCLAGASLQQRPVYWYQPQWFDNQPPVRSYWPGPPTTFRIGLDQPPRQVIGDRDDFHEDARPVPIQAGGMAARINPFALFSPVNFITTVFKFTTMTASGAPAVTNTVTCIPKASFANGGEQTPCTRRKRALVYDDLTDLEDERLPERIAESHFEISSSKSALQGGERRARQYLFTHTVTVPITMTPSSGATLKTATIQFGPAGLACLPQGISVCQPPGAI